MPSTVKVGSTIQACEGRNGAALYGRIVADPCEGYPCPAGMFLINTGTDQDPWFSFGMLTGRTRRKFGYVDCPTVVRFHVETTAITVPDVDGNDRAIIIGVPGSKMTGTWFVRPVDVCDG